MRCEKILGSVDISSSRTLRPAACPRDPGILNPVRSSCTLIEPTGSRGQAAGRRKLREKSNCQQPLIYYSLLPRFGNLTH